MALDRRSTPYGVPALQALRRAIDELQGGDPLTAVTVLVHSNAVGVAARRWLAAHGGIAAAQFLTSFRFAELLGGAALARQGRRPVSTPVVDVAVRAVLAKAPGIFAPIASHQATITALRDTARDLRHVPPTSLDALTRRGSLRAREVVRVQREVHRVLRPDWYDEADLLHEAARAAATAPPRTVLFLPQRMRSTEVALLDALSLQGDVIVLEGHDAPPTPDTLDVVDVSDADEEAREAVRIVAAAVHDGTPLHRIAVLWPRTEPYARLVGEHLDQAGVAWNGRSGIALHERLAARLVLDLFRLDRRGIRRADLFALLAHVPLRLPDRSLAPRQRWERISRDAGLAGDADWSTRLPAYAERLRARAEVDDAGVAAHRLDEAAAAEALASFVADLRRQLGSPGEPRRWEHWADVAHTVLRTWLGGFARIAQLPEVEQGAFQRVQAALDRVGRLDGLAPPVRRAEFADTLEAELDGAPGRSGHVGIGAHIGPISFAVGQEFDLVVVLGACEGLMPSPPPPEALLGDADRRLTDGALALDADLASDQQHQWWAALAGARRAVVVRPRGDLRATAQRQPSRWLGELVSGSPVGSRSVASFAAGLADAAFPVTIGQHRIRSLTHAQRAGEPLHDHPAITTVEPLRRGAAMVRARLEPRFTEYDGDLSGLHIEPLGANPISPTKLEAWVACPHAWFMRYVLGIDEVEQPDEQLQITPRDRGTLVHAALDRFHHRVLDGSLPQPGPDGWGDVHREALLAAFEQEGAALAALGVTGRIAFWQAERARQHHELTEWLRRDSEHVVARGAQLVESERSFGMHGYEPAVIPLADGTDVRMRGSVDRIDRCADGSLVVTDHKTGRATKFKGIADDDPTLGGTRFQLAAYAAAALALTGAPAGTPVLAEYSFFGKEQHDRIGARIGEATWASIATEFARVLHHIRSGMFIALPDKSQFRLSWVKCPYCDPDHLGTAEKWTEFERKSGDPRVAALIGAIEVADDD